MNRKVRIEGIHPKIELELYISGESGRNGRMIESLLEAFRKEYDESFTLKVIDLLKDQDAAEGRRIITAPTLIKVNPPSYRMIGDLSQAEKVVETVMRLDEMNEREGT